jgi:hypothetical protein
MRTRGSLPASHAGRAGSSPAGCSEGLGRVVMVASPVVTREVGVRIPAPQLKGPKDRGVKRRVEQRSQVEPSRAGATPSEETSHTAAEGGRKSWAPGPASIALPPRVQAKQVGAGEQGVDDRVGA